MNTILALALRLENLGLLRWWWCIAIARMLCVIWQIISESEFASNFHLLCKMPVSDLLAQDFKSIISLKYNVLAAVSTRSETSRYTSEPFIDFSFVDRKARQ